MWAGLIAESVWAGLIAESVWAGLIAESVWAGLIAGQRLGCVLCTCTYLAGISAGVETLNLIISLHNVASTLYSYV